MNNLYQYIQEEKLMIFSYLYNELFDDQILKILSNSNTITFPDHKDNGNGNGDRDVYTSSQFNQIRCD